jgi:hypothetical protein
MKYILMFSLSILFLQGCSRDISDQIEGIKWSDNYSKLGNSQAYTSFINGKILSCVKNEGQWIASTRYEISRSRLTILPNDKNKAKIHFDIKVKGSGDDRVLIMTRATGDKNTEMAFPISITKDCPIS